MNDATPHTPTHRKRLRLGKAVGSLRRSLSLYRALFAAAFLVAAILAVMLLSRSSGPDAIPLGTGRAGLLVPASSTPYAADEIEAEPEPLPPLQPGGHVGDGPASYYGAELAGNPTASGERFDPTKLTAAHRTLPLGSRVRVTNLRTGASVIVRINDRGPFHGHRVIDLSHAAAREIGMIRRGTARVRMELLNS